MTPCAEKNCPALATVGTLCAAHASKADRVPHKKNQPVVKCARCGNEIKQGDWRKPTWLGDYVHGGYVCEEK